MLSRKRALSFENLEQRELLYASAFVNDGILNIHADSSGGTVDAYSIWGNVYLWSPDNTDYFRTADVDRIVFYGSSYSDDFENHTTIPSSIYGYGGNDVLRGGSGNDLLFGFGGNDQLYGGNGNDELQGGAAHDVLYGDAGNDRLFGQAGNDRLYGGSGNDSLIGDDGDDRLWGGNNDDHLWGGAGNDQLYGGNGHDELQGGAAHDVLHGDAGNDRLFGQAGNDSLYGSYGNDSLVGDDGDDRLWGGNDDDHIWGGAGNDQLHGGNGNDELQGGAAHDVLHGDAGNDRLFGQAGNDKLYSGSGSDYLRGGSGDDTLVSIDGDTNDVLFGESGNDSFWLDEEGWWIFATNDDVRDATVYEKDHNVHEVDSFENGADKTLNGDNLADPTDGVHYRDFSNRPLFASSGPSERDIDQGNLGDCWLVAGLGAAAQANPNSIRQTVVELGDGTYAVELGGKYYRMDGDLPTWSASSTTPRYAGLGQQNSIWAPIVEKAYAYYRTGAGTYASLVSGWSSTVFDALGDSGANSSGFSSSYAALTHIANELSNGKAVVVNIHTAAAGSGLIGSHAYMVERVNYTTISFGFATFRVPTSITLRNPHDAVTGGLVTVTGSQLVNSIAGYGGNGVQSAGV
jgi:Ca2+-binding RTX toxin-like protein